MISVLDRTNESIEYRLRQCLAFAAICRQAKFDKLAGSRLAELLDLLTQSLSDVEVDPANIGSPSWVGRILFRQTELVYARRDTGPRKGSPAMADWHCWRPLGVLLVASAACRGFMASCLKRRSSNWSCQRVVCRRHRPDYWNAISA